MRTVMSEEKTELKILYEDGNLNRAKPYTYSIELRKWSTPYHIDYVLLRSFVNNVVDRKYKSGEQLHQRVDEKFILFANSDGKAIGQAVDSFRELKERCIKKVK